MSHFDKLVKLPAGFVAVASTKNSEYAGIAHETKSIYGVQFHPELEHVSRHLAVIVIKPGVYLTSVVPDTARY